MRIAVTGGSGFIGSHVVDRLVAAGHEVVVLDTRPPPCPDALFHPVDVGDLEAMVDASRGCDVMFHLAAVSNVNEAFAHPVETVQINVGGTANACEAARQNGMERIVLASTVWVYGAAGGDGPLSEDASLHPDRTGHVYTSSKVSSELIVHNYNELYDLPFTILRYGIPFGPRMRPELVIARFVAMALSGQPLTIEGDGLQYRNYIYVEDLAEAHVLALGDAARNQVLNLEGMEPVTIRRVCEAVRTAVGNGVVIKHLPGRPGDYVGREVSRVKTEKVLGWTPTTSFEKGLKLYLDWYLDEGRQIEAVGPGWGPG